MGNFLLMEPADPVCALPVAGPRLLASMSVLSFVDYQHWIAFALALASYTGPLLASSFACRMWHELSNTSGQRDPCSRMQGDLLCKAVVLTLPRPSPSLKGWAVTESKHVRALLGWQHLVCIHTKPREHSPVLDQ